VADTMNVIGYRNKLKQIRETRIGFLSIPLNPMSLTCVLMTVEATPGKEPGKGRCGVSAMRKLKTLRVGNT